MSADSDKNPASVNISTNTVDQLSATQVSKETKKSSIPTVSNMNFSHAFCWHLGKKVLLQTAMVTICGDNRSKASVHLLLDSDS